MFYSRETRSAWTGTHQYLYSLVWSSFLDLDAYSAARAYRRYRPYSSAWVLRELLCHLPEVRALEIGGPKYDLLHETAVALDPAFRRLALWTVTPSLFHGTMSLGEGGPRAGRQQQAAPDPRLGRLQDVFRGQFREMFGVELAAFRQSFESWPLLPPIRGGQVTASVSAGRRCATALVTADVQLPYGTLSRFVDPRTWVACGYWQECGGSASPTMRLCLPGGRLTGGKWRELQGSFQETTGAFETRLDYELTEHPTGAHCAPNLPAESESDWEEENQQPVRNPPYSPDQPQIAALQGYLSFAKIPARPGWTRIAAERTARFESPTHDRFRVETLLFWLAVELSTFSMDEGGGASPDGVHAG